MAVSSCNRLARRPRMILIMLFLLLCLLIMLNTRMITVSCIGKSLTDNDRFGCIIHLKERPVTGSDGQASVQISMNKPILDIINHRIQSESHKQESLRTQSGHSGKTKPKPSVTYSNDKSAKNTTSHLSTKPMAPNTKDTAPDKKEYIILIYTALFRRTPWRSIPYNYDIKKTKHPKCPITNCRFIYDKKLLNQSNAVVVHAHDINEPIDALREVRERVQNPDQIWLWFNHESPVESYKKAYKHNKGEISEGRWEGVFNWSVTYRLNADVFIPYFKLALLGPVDKRPDVRRNYAAGKDRVVLFITTHCDYRIDLVKKLKKHVQLDAMGACRKTREISPEMPKCPRNNKKCQDMQRRYKFYFGPENSFCEDYVSEKYYQNALRGGLVPIVYDGEKFPGYRDKRKVYPGSYINMADFPTMRALGEYLNYLNTNDTAYNEYHSWRYHFKVDDVIVPCRLCEAVSQMEARPRKMLSIRDEMDTDKLCETVDAKGRWPT